MQLIFLTHPQVVVDPAVPVERWSLSQAGRTALQQFLERALWPVPDIIWSSTETKAQETAALLAEHFNCAVQSDIRLGENDRSATGFLPAEEFEQVADTFFAHPDCSVRGWEKAADAQARVYGAMNEIINESVRLQHKTVIICGHGATGTLLYCALAGVPISRHYDQPSQGHYWRYNSETKQMLHHWQNLHELT
ncbi:histidine phosphatase family protein [Ochrobactrum sp. MR28]|nr:histidine phosphatase family protein [Ochrobactrum sp. MR28]MBX8816091.1 histidine phosphatase family protein [Ochrobactrum sp. MR31]